MSRTPSPTDTLVRSSYGDPLTRVKGAGPYQRRPERSTWIESEVYRSADGVEWTRFRDCARWASEVAYGEWYEVFDLGIEWRRTYGGPTKGWTGWAPWRTLARSAEAVRRELAANFPGETIEVRRIEDAVEQMIRDEGEVCGYQLSPRETKAAEQLVHSGRAQQVTGCDSCTAPHFTAK